jgi:hypothetical protein
MTGRANKAWRLLTYARTEPSLKTMCYREFLSNVCGSLTSTVCDKR